MAQLKDTTINGSLNILSDLTVTEASLIDLNSTNEIKLTAPNGIDASETPLYPKSVGSVEKPISGMVLKNNYGIRGQNAAGDDFIALAYVASDDYTVFGHQTSAGVTIRSGGDVRFMTGGQTSDSKVQITADGNVSANRFVTPNNYAFGSLDSNGDRKTVAYITSTNNLYVGASSVSNAHSGDTYVAAMNGAVKLTCSGEKTLSWRTYNGTSSDRAFSAMTDAKALCGTPDYRWSYVYSSSSNLQTSDEREKSDIMSIEDYPVMYSNSANTNGNVFEQLFDKLVPKTFTLNVENTDNVHIGFIAQDIVKSLEEVGMSEDDLALVTHDYWTDEETGEEKDMYSLAYGEFTALNTYMIQKQKARIAELEERVNKLEKLVTA